MHHVVVTAGGVDNKFVGQLLFISLIFIFLQILPAYILIGYVIYFFELKDDVI